nr:head-tail connector protein [Brucella anthropi]
MKPYRVAAPTVEPVSLDELKAAARVDFDDDDLILQSYLDAAVGYLDGWSGIMGRALINQIWGVSISTWPMQAIPLRFADVSSATVTYYDRDDVRQMLPSDAFEVVHRETGDLLYFRRSFTRPAVNDDRLAAVEVEFTTGYGDTPADVPAPIRTAILLLACHLYENREATSTADNMQKLPLAVDALITPHRRVLF